MQLMLMRGKGYGHGKKDSKKEGKIERRQAAQAKQPNVFTNKHAKSDK
jgi:hypothetical protein